MEKTQIRKGKIGKQLYLLRVELLMPGSIEETVYLFHMLTCERGMLVKNEYNIIYSFSAEEKRGIWTLEWMKQPLF